MPPGFVFYPGQGIVFGYPQTPGDYTGRIQIEDGAGATVIAKLLPRIPYARRLVDRWAPRIRETIFSEILRGEWRQDYSVELGAQDYGANSYLDERQAVALLIFSVRLECAGDGRSHQSDDRELARSFPSGLQYDIVYNPTEFIAESVREVQKTIFEASSSSSSSSFCSCRPGAPRSFRSWLSGVVDRHLCGARGLRFSLNNLSLFGLVLAIGIVVDDAIVVVENVERNLRLGMSPKRRRTARWTSRRRADRHRSGSVGGVYSAAFIPGSRPVLPPIRGDDRFGDDYFVLCSLTLSRLCALLFKPHQQHAARIGADPTHHRILPRLQLHLRQGSALRELTRRLLRVASWPWSSMPAHRADRLAVRPRSHRLHPNQDQDI